MLSRRSFLRFGSLGLLPAGFVATGAASDGGATAPRRRARACILLFQVGGPYQCDTFDPKPDAGDEVRGPYRPIATRVTGMRFTEALPCLAQSADKLAIIRTMHHQIRCHNPAIYCSLVGREATEPLAVSNRTAARRTDHPHYASVVARLRPAAASFPNHIIIPDVTNNGPSRSPGLLAGYLGAGYDPFVLGQDPGAPDFRVEGVGPREETPTARLDDRLGLLRELDGRQRWLEGTGTIDTMSTYYQRAFRFLTSGRTKQAFDLTQEPASLRDRYGRHTVGQSTLLARRLVEAGAPFVSVFSHTDVDRGSWDTHQRHYERVPELLAQADQSFAALLEDMAARGLLDDVLVLWMGEFGRTPRMGVQFSNNTNNTEGRDHWCNCYSVALAGGGVRGGQVIGASDNIAGYPRLRPVHISDLAATLFQALSVDPRALFTDIQGQQHLVCDGYPVSEVF